MLLERCPKCNAQIAPSDTQCLDCGEDLAKHLEELRKAATAKRWLTDKERVELAQKAAQAASRGRAFGVETSDETRLRTFDKQDAEKTKNEMLTAWATAAIALLVGLVMLKLGHDKVAAAGGLDTVRGLSMGSLRAFEILLGDAVIGLMETGIAIGALLAAAGQTWRAVLAHRSIAAVARGEKPVIVYLHPATRAGLILAAAICPPAGFIFGLLMKILGRDEDTKSLGGTMLVTALIVLGILGLNLLWGLAANLQPAPEKTAPDDTAVLPMLQAVGLRWWLS